MLTHLQALLAARKLLVFGALTLPLVLGNYYHFLLLDSELLTGLFLVLHHDASIRIVVADNLAAGRLLVGGVEKQRLAFLFGLFITRLLVLK